MKKTLIATLLIASSAILSAQGGPRHSGPANNRGREMSSRDNGFRNSERYSNGPRSSAVYEGRPGNSRYAGPMNGGMYRNYRPEPVHVRFAPPAMRYRAAYAARPLMPGPGYVWIDGYYDYDGYEYVWVDGYWALPPYAYATWFAPSFRGGFFTGGYWGR